MTDKQIVDIMINRLKRISGNDMQAKNPKIVLTQQYRKKLYFNVMFDNWIIPLPIAFSNNGKTMVFIVQELPERLMQWKTEAIAEMYKSKNHCLEFDIETFPKEIIHIFSCAVINALNTPGMGVHIMAEGLPTIFGPNETYEEVQIEADMQSFDGGF